MRMYASICANVIIMCASRHPSVQFFLNYAGDSSQHNLHLLLLISMSQKCTGRTIVRKSLMWYSLVTRNRTNIQDSSQPVHSLKLIRSIGSPGSSECCREKEGMLPDTARILSMALSLTENSTVRELTSGT